MNIIEQLGGYEKAKRELELKEQNSIFQCCTAVDAEMIRSALLQYRREHGIFEVGDWVVSTLNSGSKLETIVYQIKISHNDVITTQSVCGEVVNFYGTDFKHATDGEIKAGRRL